MMRTPDQMVSIFNDISRDERRHQAANEGDRCKDARDAVQSTDEVQITYL